MACSRGLGRGVAEERSALLEEALPGPSNVSSYDDEESAMTEVMIGLDPHKASTQSRCSSGTRHW